MLKDVRMRHLLDLSRYMEIRIRLDGEKRRGKRWNQRSIVQRHDVRGIHARQIEMEVRTRIAQVGRILHVA